MSLIPVLLVFFHDNPHNAKHYVSNYAKRVYMWLSMYMHISIWMHPCKIRAYFLDSLLTKEVHTFSLKVSQRES